MSPQTHINEMDGIPELVDSFETVIGKGGNLP
jgi:hypothetical protein